MAVPDQQLSENFTLQEMLISQPATRLGYREQFAPSAKVIYNLKLLCVHVLQPLRNALEYDLRVISGYRCPRLNQHIGGSGNSQHLQGKAVDIMDLINGNGHLFKTVLRLNLPFDQMIDEYGQSWIHISYDAFRTRREVLSSSTDKQGLVQLQRLDLRETLPLQGQHREQPAYRRLG